jgi:hypothetical protein
VGWFSTTLRNEVDLSLLNERLVAVVQETMQPAHVSLWLRPLQPEGTRSTASWEVNPLASLPDFIAQPAKEEHLPLPVSSC